MNTKKLSDLKDIIKAEFGSQAELAKRIGWTRQKINKFLTGAQIPNILEAAAIAATMGKSVDWLCEFFLH